MHELFKDNKTFNYEISEWDVSNVTNMSKCFVEKSFNQTMKICIKCYRYVIYV